jgi:hypothetical protein
LNEHHLFDFEVYKDVRKQSVTFFQCTSSETVLHKNSVLPRAAVIVVVVLWKDIYSSFVFVKMSARYVRCDSSWNRWSALYNSVCECGVNIQAKTLACDNY